MDTVAYSVAYHSKHAGSDSDASLALVFTLPVSAGADVQMPVVLCQLYDNLCTSRMFLP